MDKKTRDRLLQDAADILEIDELGHILFQKINELKILASKLIDYYKVTPGPGKQRPSTLSGDFPGRDFELNRVGEKLWIPSFPAGPGIGKIFETIPPVVLNFIGKYIEDNQTMFMTQGIRFPGQVNKLFDLAFELDGPRHISGVINIREDKAPDAPAVFEPREENPGDNVENMDEGQILQSMFEYLTTHKEFFEYMACEFIYRWKPLLDKELPKNREM